MAETVAHEGNSRPRYGEFVPVVALGGLAILTLVAALWLHVSEVSIGGPIASGSSGEISLADHLHMMVFYAVVLGGLNYAGKSKHRRGHWPLVVSGALLAAVGGGLYHHIGGYWLATAIGSGTVAVTLLYYAALYTQYDWVAINAAGLCIVPPIIVTYSGIGLPFLVGALIVLSGYDFIAVHRSGVMDRLVDSGLSLRLPVMFLIPEQGGSLRGALELDEDTPIRLLGFGDVAVPGMFIVAVAETFSSAIPLPAITALAGYILALTVIFLDPFDESRYAGIPFLTTGVLLGFALALPFI